MNLPTSAEIERASEVLEDGGIIAYPTEAVYGFGCDPFNLEAVQRLLDLKKRSAEKGFIVVASDWSQLLPLVEPIPPQLLAKVQSTWPGPYTWIFPAKRSVSPLVCGNEGGIAARISAHPTIQLLCQLYGSAIISTSANQSGFPPARDYNTVKMLFGDFVDYILPGSVGASLKPTEIWDAMSGELIRS